MGWCRDAAQAFRGAGTSMRLRSHSESVAALAAGVLADFRREFVPIALFEVVFKSTVAVVGIAGGALLLALLVRFAGTSAVTNTDIVAFLLSPTGIVIAVGLA